MKQLLMLITTALLLAPAGYLRGAEFVEIGRFSSLRPKVSADGRFVVGRTVQDEAFIWSRETGVRTLGTLPGDTNSGATDISADGSVVAGYSSGDLGPAEPFLWTEESGMVGLNGLPGFTASTYSSAISDDGSTVVGYAFTVRPPDRIIDRLHNPFRWTEREGMVNLGVPPGARSADARDVSADGNVVVGLAWSENRRDGFIWNEENGFQDLGPLPAGWDIAAPYYVSADGSTVVGSSQPWGFLGGALLFRWTRENGIQPLPKLSGVSFRGILPGGVNADGSIIVGVHDPSSASGNGIAFVWDEQHGTRDLRDVLIAEHGFSEQELPRLRWATDLSGDARTVVGNNGVDYWAIYLDKPLVSFGIPGDYNNNGLVEQEDLDLVLAHWGSDATAPPATWTNDLPTGNIDQEELDRVLVNWGNTTAGVGAAAVPEPSTAVLLMIAAIVTLAVNRASSPAHVRRTILGR